MQSIKIGSGRMSIGVLWPWVKRPQRETDHLAPLSSI